MEGVRRRTCRSGEIRAILCSTRHPMIKELLLEAVNSTVQHVETDRSWSNVAPLHLADSSAADSSTRVKAPFAVQTKTAFRPQLKPTQLHYTCGQCVQF